MTGLLNGKTAQGFVEGEGASAVRFIQSAIGLHA
jgi:hypothetical protein